MRVLNSILLKASWVGCREQVHLLRHRDLEMGKFDRRRDIDGEHDYVQGQACVGKIKSQKRNPIQDRRW